MARLLLHGPNIKPDRAPRGRNLSRLARFALSATVFAVAIAILMFVLVVAVTRVVSDSPGMMAPSSMRITASRGANTGRECSNATVVPGCAAGRDLLDFGVRLSSLSKMATARMPTPAAENGDFQWLPWRRRTRSSAGRSQN